MNACIAVVVPSTACYHTCIYFLAYGMTETAGAMHYSVPEDIKPGSIGLAVGGAKWKVGTTRVHGMGHLLGLLSGGPLFSRVFIIYDALTTYGISRSYLAVVAGTQLR